VNLTVISLEAPGSIYSLCGKISHYPISNESSAPFFLPFPFFYFLAGFFFGLGFGFGLGFALALDFFPFFPLTTPPYFSWGSSVNYSHCSSRTSLA